MCCEPQPINDKDKCINDKCILYEFYYIIYLLLVLVINVNVIIRDIEQVTALFGKSRLPIVWRKTEYCI